MPLVRVSGRDGEGFDTLDVAELTFGNSHGQQSSHRNTWSSRQSGRQRTSLTSQPILESDDVNSNDSSSGRGSDNTDRLLGGGGSSSIPSRGNLSGDKYRGQSGSGSTYSNISVGSLTSYQTGSTDNMIDPSNNNTTFDHMNMPLHGMTDNLDEMEHDPRNPFNKSHNSSTNTRPSWTDHIPEEDETSLSTMEESSVSPSVHKLSHLSQSTSSSQSYQMSNGGRPSVRQSRQRPQHHDLYDAYDDDNASVSSSTSHRSNRAGGSSKNTSPSHTNNSDNNNPKTQQQIQQYQQLVQQLETQVMKLNLELATSKSTLDEIQLKNRKASDEKDTVQKNMSLLQEENDMLHLKIERLERENLIRNMQGTKGVVSHRGSANEGSGGDHDSCVVWGGTSVSGNTWAGGGKNSNATSSKNINHAYVPVTKRALGKVSSDTGNGSLEVPFRTEGSDYHLRPRGLRSSVCDSVNSFGELSRDEQLSRSMHNDDVNSVALSESELDASALSLDLPNESASPSALVQQKMKQGNTFGLMNMLRGGGGGEGNSRRSSEKEREADVSDRFITSASSKDISKSNTGPNNRGSTLEEPFPSRHSPEKRNSKENSAVRRDSEEDGDIIGSNPQGESYNDEDPFATWSARGDPKRDQEPQRQNNKKWLQRGLGRDSFRASDSSGSVKQRAASLPQANVDIIEDPFDSCRNVHDDEGGRNNGSADDGEKYTSFGENSVADSTSGQQQERKRFGLFGGFGKGRR